MAGPNAGRRGSRWRRLVADVRDRRDPCWLCGQPIDYDAPANTPDAFEVDHRKPWADYPELREDPANLAASHHRCNRGRGRRAPGPTLGTPSRRWA